MRRSTIRPAAGEGGLKAAWDDIEEGADLDALLGETLPIPMHNRKYSPPEIAP
jgi:hypothetical protein